MKNRLREWALIFLRGLFMGMADIVPGVSGGTIALITGIYERLVFALNSIKAGNISDLFVRKDRLKLLRKMDLPFLATVLAGAGIAFIAMSWIIRHLMQAYPANTYAFFFGLILASAGFVYRYVGRFSAATVASGIAGFIFAVVFVGLSTLQSTHSLPVIFFSGFVAICAMILPGISGAFILFFLGQYEFMLGALHAMDATLVSVFLAGAVSGLLVMSRVLAYLLKKHKAVTMSFLLGLMVGALRMPLENITANTYHLPFVLLSGAAGFMLVFVLEKVGGNAGDSRSP